MIKLVQYVGQYAIGDKYRWKIGYYSQGLLDKNTNPPNIQGERCWNQAKGLITKRDT